MNLTSVQLDINDTTTASENVTDEIAGSSALHSTDYYGYYYDYYYDYHYDCTPPSEIHPLLYPHNIATNILAFIGISK